MKVIASGATGFIGGAVLQRLLATPAVTAVVVLSRRELVLTHPKLEVVVLSDFRQYDAGVRARLAGAGACIWTLGGPRDGADVHDDFTFAAVRALWEVLEGGAGQGQAATPFRFVYTSGALTVRDQEKFILIAGEKRKLRLHNASSVRAASNLREADTRIQGDVENKLIEFEQSHTGAWQSYIMRPAYVSATTPPLGLHLLGLHILKAELAAAAVDLATKGSEERTLENVDLTGLGREALQDAK